jgi:thiol-disulfide isomerase/thioredoxin
LLLAAASQEESVTSHPSWAICPRHAFHLLLKPSRLSRISALTRIYKRKNRNLDVPPLMGAEPGGLVQRFQHQRVALLTLTHCFANLHAAPQANKANSLANAKSEFLRRASSQPVAWLTLSPDAFALARQTGKPFLIEIGASWCPFCAAMDNDSYSNPQLATFLNDHYVAVRIDFDAQPELAHRLELAQSRAKLPSGFPLTMLVTPDGKLFDGGGYFPASRTKHKPSFSEFLKQGAAEFISQRFPVEPLDITPELQAAR